MAPIKALNKVKLKFEYDKYYRILKKFSKDGQIIDRNGLVNAISNEVSKDSKVQHVEKNFNKAKELGYCDIFWGCNSAGEFFKQNDPKNWITKFTGSNNLICGRTAPEYACIGYGRGDGGGYWFMWLIGKEIRKRAQIAVDGINKNKEADKDFSPKWSFIPKSSIDKDIKTTMANVVTEAAEKAAKINLTEQNCQQNKQNGQALTSTSRSKSKIIFTKRSRRHSVADAEEISNKENKFSFKKSFSKLFNKIKKSKDDTSQPNKEGHKELKNLWKSKKSKINPLNIKLNGNDYSFENFDDLKNTVINILNQCDELYSKECTKAVDEFRNLVERLKNSYPELYMPLTNAESVNSALKKYSDIIRKAKEGPLYGLNNYTNSKNGNAKHSGFEGTLAVVKPMTWDGTNLNRNLLAWEIFNGESFESTRGFEFKGEILDKLTKKYGKKGKTYSAYSSDVTALVQYLIQYAGVTKTLDENTLSLIKQLSWYKSQLLVLEKQLKTSQRKSGMLGVRKNNRQREELKDKADNKHESEKKNIKNENLNQTKKSFSKESQSELDELMEKSKKNKLSSEEQDKLKKLLKDKPEAEKELEEILEEFMI